MEASARERAHAGQRKLLQRHQAHIPRATFALCPDHVACRVLCSELAAAYAKRRASRTCRHTGSCRRHASERFSPAAISSCTSTTIPAIAASSCQRFLSPPPLPLSIAPRSYIERAKFQDAQFKEVTVKVKPPPLSPRRQADAALQDVDDTAAPLFANAKEYALVSLFRQVRSRLTTLPFVQRVLEDQLAAQTAKEDESEMT